MDAWGSENVVSLAEHKRATHRTASRVSKSSTAQGKKLHFRDAVDADVPEIQQLYAEVYGGKYSQEFAVNASLLREEIADPTRHLWLVACDEASRRVVGAIAFLFDPANRLGKAAGVVVLPNYRSTGVGSKLLKLGVEYLTGRSGIVDVMYAMTRTVNEAPSRIVEEAGFRQMGLFPNAVEVDNFEHLNLDVLLTDKALSLRRKKPYLFPPFSEIYGFARQSLKLERAYLVTERAPLQPSAKKIPFRWIDDAAEAERRFANYSEEGRVSNSFFPFHRPNRILVTEDGGTEVFLWFGGSGRQSAILGYRTDRVNIHDLLDSIATALQKAGAAYVELLVDAYNYKLQQEAFAARYLPSGYFPAMKMSSDGLRDDVFVLSRTFHLLDFSGTFLKGDSRNYLRAYLRYYHELYIKPAIKPFGG